MTGRSVVIHAFPGQGDFGLSQLLKSAEDIPQLKKSLLEVLPRVDVVGNAYGIPALTPELTQVERGATEKSLAELAPGAQQLALYGIQMSMYQALKTVGLTPDRVLGISFGEISALTAAGVFTLEEGARTAIRAARSLLHYPGGMTLIWSTPKNVKMLIEASQTSTTRVACINNEREIILTAADTRELDCVEQTAADNGIQAVRLPLPFRCHHASLAAEAADLADSLRRVPLGPASIPVYSAVHARMYVPGDDIRRRLTDSLRMPFNLPRSVASATPPVPSRWFEVGSSRALSRSLRHLLRPVHTTISPLYDDFVWSED